MCRDAAEQGGFECQQPIAQTFDKYYLVVLMFLLLPTGLHCVWCRVVTPSVKTVHAYMHNNPDYQQ